ncbi:oligosaccharide flippase family protein [Pseudaestuariivita sp.]|uniref:oligosaccharide flippase family protein n=1 Tax=Pseudaestuariivita sp. TaxID=2211669 RepID=UPI00405884A1
MKVSALMTGSSTGARIFRSVGFTAFGYVGTQAIRLGSNLILTRILFPEAFGMMALVTIILMGLTMFSDVGITPAVMSSKRGDDPDFLATAWTIQVIRGVILWLAACALATPFAWFYMEPDLVTYLPVAALSLVFMGLWPIKRETANRHLMMGRVTAIELSVHLIGLAVNVGLALWLQSVWALVAGSLISSALLTALFHIFLQGPRDRFCWETGAARELIGFGKWMFLATVCGYFYLQGDRIVLGRALELATFGVYNMGYFLASFPMIMGGFVANRLFISVYRETPPAASRENFFKMRKIRSLITAGLLGMQVTFACLGVWAVDILYDPRYAMAGPVVALLAVMNITTVIFVTYDQAALAAGEPRRYALVYLGRAIAMISCLVIGYEVYGLLGALIAQGIAMLIVYPMIVWLVRPLGAWDPAHDAAFGLLGAGLGAGALWLNWTAILTLVGVT